MSQAEEMPKDPLKEAEVLLMQRYTHISILRPLKSNTGLLLSAYICGSKQLI